MASEWKRTLSPVFCLLGDGGSGEKTLPFTFGEMKEGWREGSGEVMTCVALPLIYEEAWLISDGKTVRDRV